MKNVFAFLISGLAIFSVGAQIPCSGPFGNIVLNNMGDPVFQFDVDGDGDDDFQFAFGGSGDNYQFDITPLLSGAIQGCGDVGVILACAYYPDDFLYAGSFVNDVHLLAAHDLFMGDIGEFFPGVTQYIAIQLEGRRGWIEIDISSISGSEVNFAIGQYGVEAFSGIDPIQVGNCGSILPIVLGDYHLKSTRAGLELSWEVLSSYQVDHFSVEKLIDNQFQSMARISEIYDAPYRYSWLDKYPEQGENTYRVSIHNLDGSIDFTSIKSLNWNSTEILIYPNPVGGDLVFIRSHLPGSLKIIDGAGRIIQQSKIKEDEAEIDVREWPPGTYQLHYEDQNHQITGKKIIMLKPH